MNGDYGYENEEIKAPTEQQIRKKKIVKKAAKKRRRSSFAFTQILAVLIVFLAFYLAISLFIAGSIYYSFNSTAKNT